MSSAVSKERDEPRRRASFVLHAGTNTQMSVEPEELPGHFKQERAVVVLDEGGVETVGRRDHEVVVAELAV